MRLANRALLRSPARLAIALAACAALSVPAAAQLLVVSRGDARVLEYDADDGSFLGALIEPVTAGFAFPGGIAIRPSDGRLYVASTASGEIWVYDAPTGLASPPPAATGLEAPGGLAFDASGSTLYFLADVPNGPDSDAALQKLELGSGAVTTLASDGTASYSALALEGSQLYVSDSENGEVVRFPVSGGNGTTVVSGLVLPAGIAFPSPSVMLVAESGVDRVVEYHENGGSWSFHREVLPASAGVDAPFGLAIAPDGRLTVSGSQSNDVVAVDLGTLATETLVAPGSGLVAAGQVAWSGNTLLVASRAGNTVVYYDQSGSPTGIIARGLTSGADAGITLTADGNVLVASTAGNDMIEVDGVTGGTVRKLPNACTISFTAPFAVAVDGAGDVYVTCPAVDGVRSFDTLGVSVPFVLGGTGGLGNPRGLRFGPNGNLFVASGEIFSHQVLEFDGGTGAFVGVFVDTTGNGGGAIDPYGLVFHQGSLFVASFAQNDVKEFDAASGAFVQVFVAPGSGGLAGPRGLAFGPDGDLYVTSDGDDSVKRYDGATGSFVESFVAPASGGLDQPFDLVFLAGTEPPTVPALPPFGRALLAGALAALAGARLARRPRGHEAGERS